MRPRHLLIFSAGLLIGAAVIAGVAFKYSNEKEETVDVKPDGRLQYKWYAPELPKAMTFAGERVPLERWEIKEQLDRELLYNYYNFYSTIYILKLAPRYFPVIEERLKANGIPEDFKYLCVAESALRNQTSSAGAVGFWQFMAGTAPTYGLEITNEVDERYSIEKSTDAACKYFRQAHDRFGSWTAAAASYNCGLGGYANHSTFQHTGNYYDTMLPEETMRYVFRIITFKYLMSNAAGMGFIVEKTDAYPPVKTRKVSVTSSVPDLAVFAAANGSNYRMLKLLNPWLRDRKLTVKAGKSYEIEFPATGN